MPSRVGLLFRLADLLGDLVHFFSQCPMASRVVLRELDDSLRFAFSFATMVVKFLSNSSPSVRPITMAWLWSSTSSVTKSCVGTVAKMLSFSEVKAIWTPWANCSCWWEDNPASTLYCLDLVGRPLFFRFTSGTLFSAAPRRPNGLVFLSQSTQSYLIADSRSTCDMCLQNTYKLNMLWT